MEVLEAIRANTEARVPHSQHLASTAVRKSMVAPIKPVLLPNGQISSVSINFANAVQGKKATVPENIVSALPVLSQKPPLMRVIDVALQIQEILTSIDGNKNDQLLMLDHCFGGINGVRSQTVEQLTYTLRSYLNNSQLFAQYKAFVMTPKRYTRETMLDFLTRVVMHANFVDKAGLNRAFATALRAPRNYPEQWQKECQVAFNAFVMAQPSGFDEVMHHHRDAVDQLPLMDGDGKGKSKSKCSKCGKKHAGQCPKPKSDKYCTFCKMKNHSTEECNKKDKGTKRTNDRSGTNNRVPKEEIQRRKSAGLCIKCGDSGHTAKACTKGWTPPKKPKQEGQQAE
jgi:hypothetical protein